MTSQDPGAGNSASRQQSEPGDSPGLHRENLSTIDAGQRVLLPPPSDIDGFDLLDKTGSGGSATVYRAWDQELRRIVAIKFPRFRALPSLEHGSFLQEARTVARLRHPHIVPVYDVRRHNGEACIVSHFVDGQNLRQWIDESDVSISAAVEVAVQILDALDHAHKAGVIHRDLKPENVMVDETGHVYVTDFGLAASAAANEHKKLTRDDDSGVIGTPGYISPEQAAGTVEKVDRQSDIYSFGVILFELLTGRRPFDEENEELLRVVQETKPPEARSFNPEIDRDLNAIVACCLAPAASDRFRTTDEIADELLRWRLREPVRCRPVSEITRVTRWIFRNPATAALFAIISFLLVASSLFSVQLASTAQQEAKAATELAASEQQQRKRAEARLLTSLKAVDSITLDIVGDIMQNVPGMERTQLELLQRACSYYESLLETAPDDIRLHAAKATVHRKIGLTEQMLGRLEFADQEFKKALKHCALLERHLQYRSVRADCIRADAMLKKRRDDIESATREISYAVQLTESFQLDSNLQDLTDEVQYQLLTRATCLSASGVIQRHSDPETAEQHLQGSIDLLDFLLSNGDGCDAVSIYLARTHKTLAALYSDRQESDLARQHLVAAISAVQSQNSCEEDHHRCRELGSVLFNAAFVYQDLGDSKSAEEHQLRSIEIRETLANEYPAIVDYPEGIARSYAFLGDLRKKAKDMPEALSCHQKAFGIRKEIAERFHSRIADNMNLARSHRSLGLIHQALGEMELAEEQFSQAVKQWHLAAASNVNDQKIQVALYGVHRNLVFVCDKLKRSSDADDHLLASVRIARKLAGRSVSNRKYRQQLDHAERMAKNRGLRIPNEVAVSFAQPVSHSQEPEKP